MIIIIIGAVKMRWYRYLQEHLLGLTDRSHLYAGDAEVFSTSFCGGLTAACSR